MEGKIAVLGDTDFVMPFSALGVDTYAVDTPERISEAATNIVGSNYALVVVAENIASLADAVFSEYQDQPIPCVVVVPFTTESEGFATEALAKVLKMATGINIMENS